MADGPEVRSRALWRRQVLLSVSLCIALAGAVRLSYLVANAHDEAVARRRFQLPAPDTTGLVVGLVVTGVIAVALLVAACVHAYRIATLTFRRGEN